MARQYQYDNRGRCTGYTSDEPPVERTPAELRRLRRILLLVCAIGLTIAIVVGFATRGDDYWQPTLRDYEMHKLRKAYDRLPRRQP